MDPEVPAEPKATKRRPASKKPRAGTAGDGGAPTTSRRNATGPDPVPHRVRTPQLKGDALRQEATVRILEAGRALEQLDRDVSDFAARLRAAFHEATTDAPSFDGQGPTFVAGEVPKIARFFAAQRVSILDEAEAWMATATTRPTPRTPMRVAAERVALGNLRAIIASVPAATHATKCERHVEALLVVRADGHDAPFLACLDPTGHLLPLTERLADSLVALARLGVMRGVRRDLAPAELRARAEHEACGAIRSPCAALGRLGMRASKALYQEATTRQPSLRRMERRQGSINDAVLAVARELLVTEETRVAARSTLLNNYDSALEAATADIMRHFVDA